MTTGTDAEWMTQALALAEGVRRRVTPNPWVGAVLVTSAGEVFTGATAPPGGPHAEVSALTQARDAGASAAGATMYSTLEPCVHHGRTPPCTDALLEAGIAHVVVGIEDPDAQVAGRGIRRLRDAGVEVTVGVQADAVRDQLAPYLTHRLTGRPWVTLKLAATLDGRTAAADGTSQWISGAEARADAHQLRADHDAVLVGAGTVRADDPALTVRDASGEDPLRVVLGHAPAGARVHPALELSGPLDEVLVDLGRRGVLSLLVEGGATVAHAFHAAGLVDRYVIYLAAALMGGDDGAPLLRGTGAKAIDDLWRGRITEVRRLGDDLRVDVVAKAA
ncbi:MAG: bifunctional diaminohydroxyphosphoribosylaminopyrimidine deaminase/5-amino-6-(5-phosphoribosylamino)uracil reductase RibD [Acidimicrobiales bacterium]